MSRLVNSLIPGAYILVSSFSLELARISNPVAGSGPLPGRSESGMACFFWLGVCSCHEHRHPIGMDVIRLLRDESESATLAFFG